MKIKTINEIYFSPTETTKKTVKAISQYFNSEIKNFDLLKNPSNNQVDFDDDTLTVVGMPVYAGRIPQVCVDSLRKLKSSGSPAIAVVAFGNRDYDDALLELKDILEDCGFTIIAAGAFVTQHSIFPKAGENRPDKNDFDVINNFAENCSIILDKFDDIKNKKIDVKGNKPYKEVSIIPIIPDGNRNCTNCGACSKICPTNSIDKDTPRKTNKETCISCSACIHVCPVNARGFHSILFKIASKKFYKNNSTPKKSELFYL